MLKFISEKKDRRRRLRFDFQKLGWDNMQSGHRANPQSRYASESKQLIPAPAPI